MVNKFTSAISVIIPVYTVEKYVKECLESVINQTFKDFEIICVDDRGADGSMDIVRDFAGKDRRIKIVTMAKNSGPGAARNAGIKNASGKYIAFVDPDDFLDLAAFEKAYDILEKTGVDSVWFKIKEYYEESGITVNNMNFRYYSQGYIELGQNNISSFLMAAYNKIYLTDFIKKYNILFSEGILYEDTEFYYLFCIRSPKVYFIDEFLYIYRKRSDSCLSGISQGKVRCENVSAVTLNIYNYMKANDLLEKNKISFMSLCVRNIMLFISLPAYTRRIVSSFQKVLAYMDFPSSFDDSKNQDFVFLSYVSKYDFSKKFRNKTKKVALSIFLLLLEALPLRRLKKKIKKKIKPYRF